MHPAIFLDRDGVIIENQPAYVRSWDDVQFIPQALVALARLRDSLFKIVIVTNQSAIGRGQITLSEADSINRRLVQVIEKAGGRIDGVFMCPHAPIDQCQCRKPLPGLLIQAAKELDLDLNRSVVIGDALSDLQAGQAAGVPQLFLLRTGRGAIQEKLTDRHSLPPFLTFDTLSGALDILAPS